MPYEIDFSKENIESKKDLLVYYEDHDDYTFWYKLNFEDAQKFSYEVSSLDNQDNFDIYFYQYEGTNFCRSFIQEDLELISFDRKVELKSDKNTSYYIGIFPLFPGGCGHQINFKVGETGFALSSRNAKVDCHDEEVVLNPEEVEDKEGIKITGKVIDKKSGQGLNASIALIDPFTGHRMEIEADDETGFEVNLLEDGDYKVLIKAFGYEDLISALSAYDGENYEYKLKSSVLHTFVLEQVYFYPNTYALKEESETELKSIYSFLKNHPGKHIQIIGHTNGDKNVKASRMVREKGPEWNFNGSAKELSLRRAEKIKTFLIEKGIKAELIKTMGKGGEEMIVDNPSNMKEAMKNIRVEVKVIDQG